MAFREQKLLLEELKKHERKLIREELDFFKICEKRQKDEEEFDTVTLKKLKELVEKYKVKVDKSKFDHFFKKPE